MDGNRAGGSRNPSMSAAGRTFDGSSAAGGIQSSAAGTPTAMDGGSVGTGARDRFSPSKTLDTKELPPVKKVEEEKNGTPYQTQMYVAIGAILAAMLLLAILGGLKDKMTAASLKERIMYTGFDPVSIAARTEAIAEYNGYVSMAKILSGLATACGALATAMGVMIMTAYDQKLQGGLLAGVGALVTLQAGSKFMKIVSMDPMETAPADEKAFTALTNKFSEAISSSFFGSF